MSQVGLKMVVELRFRAVTCPGVHLPAKDDIYLSVCVLNQYRKSECLPAVFPSVFQMKIRFQKIFRYATDPADIAEILSAERVKVDLIQLIPPVGEVLARYEVDARSFLFPEPKLVPSFSGVDQEALMARNPSFPGISPRLEFSTRTKISEWWEDDMFRFVPGVSSDRFCSDTEDLLDYTQEPCQCLRLLGYKGSPSSTTLSDSNMASLRKNRTNVPQIYGRKFRSECTASSPYHKLCRD